MIFLFHLCMWPGISRIISGILDPTTLSFFNLSLGFTSNCLSVLVGLKNMGTSYLLKSLLSSSEIPLMYVITTGNFLFLWNTVCEGCKLIWSLSWFSWIMEVFVGVEWSPWSMTQSGYPLRCNAFHLDQGDHSTSTNTPLDNTSIVHENGQPYTSGSHINPWTKMGEDTIYQVCRPIPPRWH